MLFDPITISAENLILILSDPEQRRQLNEALEQEQGRSLPLNNRYNDLAQICQATSEQLDHVAKTLLGLGDEYGNLLSWLTFHPNMAEETLFFLLEHNSCHDQMAHHSGPQKLLEDIATKYGHYEAIINLLIHYYSKPDYPTDAFAIFLEKYSSVLRGYVQRMTNLPPDKQEVALRLFGSLEKKTRRFPIERNV